MLVKTYASTVHGVDAQTITVEVSAGGQPPPNGPWYFLVGLPDNVVKESVPRIETAMKSIKYQMMRMKMVINLAPADIRKEGSSYDLPIAIGILAAQEQISNTELDKYIMMGELSLDGSLRPIKGALPIAIQARDIISVARTGSGKTCGFLLPAFHKLIADKASGKVQQNELSNNPYAREAARQPTILVLAPTRELTVQIETEARKFARPCGFQSVW